MKTTFNLITILVLIISLLTVSCDKNDDVKSMDEFYKDIDADLNLEGNGKLEKTIVVPLVKTDDCMYIVAGTINYHYGDKIVAIVDYGDGTCDNIATKTIDDKIIEFNLDKGDMGNKPGYKKVIVEPIVKIDDCEYIVSGVIKFFKGDKWVATIDYGNGQCDELATKYWDGGSEEFSMTK